MIHKTLQKYLHGALTVPMIVFVLKITPYIFTCTP